MSQTSSLLAEIVSRLQKSQLDTVYTITGLDLSAATLPPYLEGVSRDRGVPSSWCILEDKYLLLEGDTFIHHERGTDASFCVSRISLQSITSNQIGSNYLLRSSPNMLRKHMGPKDQCGICVRWQWSWDYYQADADGRRKMIKQLQLDKGWIEDV